MDKIITVGIPAYKAQSHISDLLSSIQTQTARDVIKVVISNDNPGDKYDKIVKNYPDLEIKVIDCTENGGPGVARQRILDQCDTDWITFCDADDIFLSPFAIEYLLKGVKENVIEVQSPFCQEIRDPNPQGIRMMPRNDVGHPWVFGRLYNAKFLKESGIQFGKQRAMEDGQLNWEVRMTIEGSPLLINVIDFPTYLWRTGSEHSITRIGIKENDGMPLYNFDLCQVGATAAAINAIKFCKKKNPFNGNILRFTVEMMIGQYFTYIECLGKKPLFAKQNLFNAKRMYHSVYKEIESQISDEIINNLYTMQMAGKSAELIGIIPEITFFDFMEKVKTEPYGGKEEFDSIRAELPEWVTELDKKSGVLGEEGYIYTEEEDK